MKKASRLMNACAWAAMAMAHSGTAHAGGGRISFSGALVNPSCHLISAVTPDAKGVLQGVVTASQCGPAPSAFSTTVQVTRSTASIGQGIAQVSVHETAAGPILEVSYN